MLRWLVNSTCNFVYCFGSQLSVNRHVTKTLDSSCWNFYLRLCAKLLFAVITGKTYINYIVSKSNRRHSIPSSVHKLGFATSAIAKYCARAISISYLATVWATALWTNFRKLYLATVNWVKFLDVCLRLLFFWLRFFHYLRRYFWYFSEISREPDGWTKFDYYRTFDLSLDKVKDDMERVDARKVSTAEFMAKYERTYTPCVVTHAQDNWQANKKWTFPVKIILHLVCIKVFSCVVSSRYSSACNTKFYHPLSTVSGRFGDQYGNPIFLPYLPSTPHTNLARFSPFLFVKGW